MTAPAKESYVPVKISVLLHCPPKGGSYDGSRPVGENLDSNLGLEKFDVVCVLRNRISGFAHLILADTVLHDQSGPLSVQTCRSYLAYVSRLKPTVSGDVAEYVG